MDKWNENSTGLSLNKTFFCVIAANADRKEDNNAIKNQDIYL